jgi:hypothetical protein
MDNEFTHDTAYRAMFYFLESLFKETDSDYLAGLLGELALLPDGGSADPAHRKDFEAAVARARIDMQGVNLKFT